MLGEVVQGAPNVMRERTALLGQSDLGPVAEEPLRLDAAVLKMNQRSLRVRVLSEAGQITFRCRNMCGSCRGKS